MSFLLLYRVFQITFLLLVCHKLEDIKKGFNEDLPYFLVFIKINAIFIMFSDITFKSENIGVQLVLIHLVVLRYMLPSNWFEIPI